MESWRRNPRTFWVFALPPSLWLVLFFLVPLAMVWVMSFGEKVGLIDIVITWRPDNYMRALDPLYLQIFLKSFWFAGLTTLVCLIAGFMVAVAISFAPPRRRPLLLLLVMLPFWTNLLIRTYANVSYDFRSELPNIKITPRDIREERALIRVEVQGSRGRRGAVIDIRMEQRDQRWQVAQ